MNRHAFFTASLTAALLLLFGCDGGTTEDAGGGGEDAGTDAGTTETDAGFDAGPTMPDAGGGGCTGSGCEFVELDLGALHSCGRRGNGEVLCWGYNQDFQLGDNRQRHEECADPGTPPRDCSGRPVNVRLETGGAFPIIDDATALGVDGFSSSCALRGGQMWCWSYETVPQVAGGIARLRRAAQLDNDLTDVRAASVTGSVGCVVRGESREVLCVGDNIVGQLGRGDISQQELQYAPVLLDATATPPVALTGVLQLEVAVGSFACARTATDVHCWGVDTSDQMGDRNEVTRTCRLSATENLACAPDVRTVGGSEPLGVVSDISVGAAHACAIVSAPSTPPTAGPVVCWGDNRMAQTGQPDPSGMQSIDRPTPVTAVRDAIQLATGSRTTYALHADGTISAWGYNDRGQLGDGVMNHGTRCTAGEDAGDCSIEPVAVAGIDDAVHISANASHACAIRANGSVWCWGLNTSRQLGDGTRETRFTPVMVLDTAP
ncbi:MAG: hypothetical protein KF729_01250 [Sandaracinaceae bacterium]|nr:hypothetical protein [Sandaracinaceae bacterium]